MATLKVQVAPGVWQVVGSKGQQGEPGPQVFVGPSPPTDPALDLWWDSDADGSSSMTQALGDARYVLKTELYRWRVTRAATTIATGDQQHLGTGTFPENSGGFSGSATSATPLIVPVAGSYAITLQYSGFAFAGASPSASIIEAGGKTSMIPLLQGTTTWVGGTLILALDAFDTVVFKIRNNHGASATTVQMAGEVVKVA
jgi:hypothetical protein